MNARRDAGYVREISTLTIDDAEEAGGKGANMGRFCSTTFSTTARSWRYLPTESTRTNYMRRRTGTSPSSAGSC